MPEATVIHVRDMQPGDVYIGRSFHRGGYNFQTSPWANPFPIGYDEKRRGVVIEQFRQWVLTSNDPKARWIREHARELRGKRLACWCHPKACHGDVLAELAAAAP